MWPWRVKMPTQNLWRSLLLLIYILGDGPMGKTQPWTSRWQALLLAPTLPPLVLVEHEKSRKMSTSPFRAERWWRKARGPLGLAGFGLVLMMKIVLATVCCRFGSWGFVIKLNFWSDFQHKVWSGVWSWSSDEILKLKFGQYFAADFVEILNLMLGRDSEDEIWSRFM